MFNLIFVCFYCRRTWLHTDHQHRSKIVIASLLVLSCLFIFCDVILSRVSFKTCTVSTAVRWPASVGPGAVVKMSEIKRLADVMTHVTHVTSDVVM